MSKLAEQLRARKMKTKPERDKSANEEAALRLYCLWAGEIDDYHADIPDLGSYIPDMAKWLRLGEGVEKVIRELLDQTDGG